MKFYEVNGHINSEKLEKYNNDNNIFFRFQKPEWEIDEAVEVWSYEESIKYVNSSSQMTC